ncbi:hypothetical protein DOTSEDRAFT_52117 [Dothistroma septosporum NZE10]|uniref:F-box domain-containing protein n=1 Tax=Dothistroma septosporum (strain NZE10 / CBS 128990) TaxID=675120 RepID=N1PTJ1_DOTSN|nr:hypothetical protein DOTSEDRAFT_52117 [Dothistroma septosporum NZE10]
MDTTTPFRLFDLPAELRLTIYEYTFSDNAPADLDLLNIQDHHPRCDLLKTCHQIYNEAHQTYTQATKHFFQNRSYYLNITYDHTDEDFMKFLCRRLSQHRLKDQKTITLRFFGLETHQADGFVSLEFSPDAQDLLTARSHNNVESLGEIARIFGWVMNQPRVHDIKPFPGKIDSRELMVCLATILKVRPDLREMFDRGQKV